MNLAVFAALYFTLGSVYHYLLGRTWRLAEEAMQESEMLDKEIAAFKLVAVVFWPLFLCLDIVFPE